MLQKETLLAAGIEPSTWKESSLASSLPEGAMTLTRSNWIPLDEEEGERGEEGRRFRLPQRCSRWDLLITSSISETLHLQWLICDVC